MVLVPGDSPDAGFLIGAREVTNLEYAAWLDELDEGERAAHLPPRGFATDPSAPGRPVVEPGREDDPVEGIRPADAAGYAAWRAAVWGLPLRLPTEQEWRRAAGSHLLDPRHARWFAPPAEAGAPDVGPYGARGMLTGPGEVVQDGDAFRAMGAPVDGAPLEPSVAAFAAGPTLAPDQPAAGLGFRIAQDVR
jgi:formylglycine-generating enzyme required for sulfatase activity